jgi:hypothetical protein
LKSIVVTHVTPKAQIFQIPKPSPNIHTKDIKALKKVDHHGLDSKSFKT